MTRTFDGKVHCPKCGNWHTQETALERWIRDSPELDSRGAGLVRFDCDILLHRYKTPRDNIGLRDLQCIMFIEAKTHWANLTDAQRDTLSMFNQVLRNRKRNIHGNKKGRHAADHVPLAKCYSFLLDRDVRLWLFGGHLLRMSDNSPLDSSWMSWDNRDIDTETLIKILRFERDPDDITRSLDFRRRYSSFQLQSLQKKLFTKD